MPRPQQTIPSRSARKKAVTTSPSMQAEALKAPRKPIDPNVSYNDIQLDNWKEYDEILTDSLWNMSSRDKSGGHQLDYHGNCIPQILTQLLTRFTKKDEVVIDLFLGSGTTAIEAERLNRQCIGVELAPHMAEYVQEKIKSMNAAERHDVIRGNSQDNEWTGKKIDSCLKKRKLAHAHFVFMHPPYDDIIQFSDHPDDLSNMKSTEDFVRGFEDVARLAYSKLMPGRFAAVVIGDKYANKELVPLGFQCMQAMNNVGFKTKSIIVKNMTGNERGKGKTANLWRYRALKGGFYIFKHEYVMIFQKP